MATNIPNINAVISNISDITLKNILGETGSGADISILVKSITSSLLGVSVIEPTISSTDSENIKVFLNAIASAATAFMDFLDYDGDGSVNLVKRDADNNIIMGDDIIAIEKDFNNIKSSFKNHGDIGTTLLAILTSLTIYFTNKNNIAEEKKFTKFYSACKEICNVYGPIKSLNTKQLFKDNAQDIVTFVIMLCIIIIPTIELANQKIAAIKTSTAEGKPIDPADIKITNVMINQAVIVMYGSNLTYILSSVNSVVGVFVRMFNTVQCVSCTRCC
jgi:hypothetical protein